MTSFHCYSGPLIALPAELIDHRRGQTTLVSSECSEGRPFLFDLLKQECMLEKGDIWKHIFPYRRLELLCQSTSNSCQDVYEFFLSSLESWFSINRLTPLNFKLWSIAMLLIIVRDLSKDLEARRIYFRLISEDMSDLFRAASPEQLSHLAEQLLAATPTTKSQASQQKLRPISSRH